MARRRSRSPAPGEGAADLAEAVEAEVAECERRHREVLEQLARAIALQKQEEAAAVGAQRAAAALEARTRAALGQADDARRAGDEAAAAAHDREAARVARQLAAARRHAEALASAGGGPAQEAVGLLQAHLEVVRRQLFERREVLGQLRRAELHESLRRSLDAARSDTAGNPSGDRLGREVQARHAEAEAAAEVALARARATLGRRPHGPGRWAPAEG